MPEVEVLDVYAEGVLCGSLDQDLDMDPEEGYMQIAGRAGNDVLCHSRLDRESYKVVVSM